MPVDLSKPHSDRRKVNRDAAAGLRQDGMYSREIEMKRNRGEISCAECRRLSATSRFHASHVRGEGAPLYVPMVVLLQDKELGYGRFSSSPLPNTYTVGLPAWAIEFVSWRMLLPCSKRAILRSRTPSFPQESEDEGADEIAKSLGTLTVFDHGVSRFFGFTGGSDLLLFSLNNGLVRRMDDSVGSPSQTTESDSSRSSLPLHLQRFSYSFPFTPTGTVKQNIDTIKNYLPPWDRALLINETLPAIYGKRTAYAVDHNGPHDLALLFSVFALGSVMDSSLPNATAELEKPSVVTIQTLHVLSVYNAMLGGDVSGGESSMESTWSLVAVACHLAQTVRNFNSLRVPNMSFNSHAHRLDYTVTLPDGSRTQGLFKGVDWCSGIYLSQMHGMLSRQADHLSSNRAFVDCKFPQEGDEPTTLDPGDVSSMGAWMFRFGFEAMAEIVARTLTAAPPRYSTIKELDRKVHEFRIAPETLQAIRGGPGVDPRSVPIPASMIAFMLSNIQDVGRSIFLPKALIEDPENPIRGQYAPSFLATVRASKNILRTVEEQLPIQPVIVSRFWTIWTFTFSAAFRSFSPSSQHTARAHPWRVMPINELDKAYSLIEIASKNNRRAAKALAILDRMREKAHRALAAVRTSSSHPQPDGVKQEEIEDDFVVFAGRRRVFRPGGNATPSQHAAPMPPDPLPHDEQAGESSIGVGEWLARQEQYHQQHQQHERQYGYAPEQPQYTLEAVPPPHYMTAPYASYAPPPHPPHQLLHPHNLHPSSHTPGMGLPSHELHADELADMHRDYAVTVRAPPAELAQLGFAANGSRMSETWVSFMQ
ncbi:hypothetical protein EDB84DRAFT_1627502 [Lactarius hengduanensis]|nr:hypothetical protein EDB84DRAFT_1627502 [Lactarius hengduanensis]